MNGGSRKAEVQEKITSQPSPNSSGIQALDPTLSSLGSLLQSFSEKAGLPYSVPKPPKGCGKFEFFLILVEGHRQVAELHGRNRCQEVSRSPYSSAPPTISPRASLG